MMRRLLSYCLFLLLAVLPGAAFGQVAGTLVSKQESVQPGSAVIVALRLDHDEGWHTYWSNPGIGDPTKIEWDLPSGWMADQIDWPVPVKIFTQAGDLSGHGFKDVTYLPVRLLVPTDAAVGDTVTLSGKADWLMCEYEICIPGGSEVSLSLPVVEDTPRSNSAVVDALGAQAMPEAGTELNVAAKRRDKTVSLNISGLGEIKDPHFFSHTEMIWHDTPQEFEGDETGLSATLTIDDYWEEGAELLSGVLAFTDSRGDYRGVLIGAPLERVAGTDPLNVTALLQALLFAFLGGLILNLMPCVLPILSLKALSFAKMSSDNPSAARRDGLAYTAGVMLSFAAIAGLLLFIRATFGGVGWGFQLQNPTIVLILALLIAAVGFNLLGVFEIGSSVQGTGQGLTRGENLSASFFTGVLAVVVAAPCTAPFMASALGVALVQPAPIAVAVFLALGFGLAFPYLLLSFVPGARALLPKPGPWMITMKQVLAFSMFATCIWLLWVLGAQVGHNGMAVGLIAILLLGMTVGAFAKEALVWKVLGSVAFVVMLYTAFSVANLPKVSGNTENSETALFQSAPYSEVALASALDEGGPLFVYFTADWCIICKVNERVAIYTDETAAYFDEAGINVMVGDWTSYDAQITEILTAYDRAGVPMYLYFEPGAAPDEGRVLPQTLTPSILRNAIEEAV